MYLMSARSHALLDYPLAVTLSVAPWLFGFDLEGEASWAVLVSGAALILANLWTDYALGAVRALPLPAHLALDAAVGAFLLSTPWLLGFAEVVAWPHVVIGSVLIGSAILTKAPSGTAHRPAAAGRRRRCQDRTR